MKHLTWLVLHISLLSSSLVGALKLAFITDTSVAGDTEMKQITTSNVTHIVWSSQDTFLSTLSVCQSVSAGVALYVVDVRCAALHPLLTLLEQRHLAYILLTARCDRLVHPQYGLELYDAIDGRLVADVVAHQAWSNIILVYDQSFKDTSLVDQLMTSLSRRNVTLTSQFHLHRGASVARLVPMFKRPAQTALPHVVLAANHNILSILKQASSLYMRRSEYKWLLLSKTSRHPTLQQHLLPSDNVALIELSPKKADLAFLFNQLINQQGSGELRNVGSSAAGNRKCACPYNRADLEKWTAKLKSHWNNLVNNVGNVYKIYSSLTQQDGIPKMIQTGLFSRQTEELTVPSEVFPNAYHGFNGRKFVVSSVEYSFFQKKKIHLDGRVEWTGLTFEILDGLSKDLNFTYEVVEPPDGEWGIRKDNGNWTGMIEQVRLKAVDFAAACFSITGQREEVVDFAHPYFHDQSVVVIRRPDEDYKALLFAKPFKYEVWMCIVAAVVLASTLLWLNQRFSPMQSCCDRVPCDIDSGLNHPGNCCLYVYGALMQQGGIWLPVSQSGRLIVGWFWFFSIVIFATYTGNLIAFLAITTVDMPFNSLSEMVSQNTYRFGTAEGVAMVMLFKEAKFDPYMSVHRKMHTSKTYKIGLQRVKEENYAFLAEKSWYQSVSSSDCSLAMIREEFYPTNYAWAFQERAPYLSLFSDKISKMREAGLLKNWIKKWTPKNLQCKGLGPVTRATVATLSHFQGGFYVLGFGLTLSCLLLTGEVLLKLRKQRQPEMTHSSSATYFLQAAERKRKTPACGSVRVRRNSTRLRSLRSHKQEARQEHWGQQNGHITRI